MRCPLFALKRLTEGTFLAQVEHHEVLTSTNDLAKEKALCPTQELPLLILADRQTSGRGRGTKRWWTGPGSLAFSLILAPPPGNLPAGQVALVSLAAALAVIDTVKPLVPRAEITLHWPNDVYANGRKLCGILVEILANRRQVIGVGLNTNNVLSDAPSELRDVATTLRTLTGKEHDHPSILEGFLRHFETSIGEVASAPEQITQRADH